MSDAVLMELDGWVLRTRKPSGNGPFPVTLMLHGWTGDENSMWVFAQRLPRRNLLIAPRGLYPAPLGGYGWHPPLNALWPQVDDFRPAVEALLNLLTGKHFPQGDFTQLSMVGFSQGAALMYAFALLQPRRLSCAAALSGFVPEGNVDYLAGQPLKGANIFVTHGTRDELVPVIRAREGNFVLEQAGAEVTYCEDDVGHKLSINCFKALEDFFRRGGDYSLA